MLQIDVSTYLPVNFIWVKYKKNSRSDKKNKSIEVFTKSSLNNLNNILRSALASCQTLRACTALTS